MAIYRLLKGILLDFSAVPLGKVVLKPHDLHKGKQGDGLTAKPLYLVSSNAIGKGYTENCTGCWQKDPSRHYKRAY